MHSTKLARACIHSALDNGFDLCRLQIRAFGCDRKIGQGGRIFLLIHVELFARALCRPGRTIIGLFEGAVDQSTSAIGDAGCAICDAGCAGCSGGFNADGGAEKAEGKAPAVAERVDACDAHAGAASTARSDVGARSGAGLGLPAAARAGDGPRAAAFCAHDQSPRQSNLPVHRLQPQLPARGSVAALPIAPPRGGRGEHNPMDFRYAAGCGGVAGGSTLNGEPHRVRTDASHLPAVGIRDQGLEHNVADHRGEKSVITSHGAERLYYRGTYVLWDD